MEVPSDSSHRSQQVESHTNLLINSSILFSNVNNYQGLKWPTSRI